MQSFSRENEHLFDRYVSTKFETIQLKRRRNMNFFNFWKMHTYLGFSFINIFLAIGATQNPIKSPESSSRLLSDYGIIYLNMYEY